MGLTAAEEPRRLDAWDSVIESSKGTGFQNGDSSFLSWVPALDENGLPPALKPCTGSLFWADA